MGGNPGSVNKSEGDLPSAIETGAQGRKNLIAVLTGSASAGHRRSNPLAPWKSRRDLAGLPTPSAASVAREQSQVELPKWIKVDAHLTYMSRSSGKMMEVVVEMINGTKCEVEITFVEDSKIWKVLPFNLLASANSPLLGPWAPSNTGTGSNSSTAASAGAASGPRSADVVDGTEAASSAKVAAAATVQTADNGRPPGSSAKEAIRETGTHGRESHSRSRSPRGRGTVDSCPR